MSFIRHFLFKLFLFLLFDFLLSSFRSNDTPFKVKQKFFGQRLRMLLGIRFFDYVQNDNWYGHDGDYYGRRGDSLCQYNIFFIGAYYKIFIVLSLF